MQDIEEIEMGNVLFLSSGTPFRNRRQWKPKVPGGTPVGRKGGDQFHLESEEIHLRSGGKGTEAGLGEENGKMVVGK